MRRLDSWLNTPPIPCKPMHSQCHINKLTIKVNDAVHAHHAQVVIEDAFRTASFPNVPKQGLIFIKKIKLKKYQLNSSSVQVSHFVDQAILNAQCQLVDWPNVDLVNASSVWFADEYRPYELLLKACFKKQHPKAWYWKLAVKEYANGVSLNDLCESVFTHLMNDDKSWAAISRVVNYLLEESISEVVINEISREQADKWLKVKGAYISVGINEKCALEQSVPFKVLPKKWKIFLYKVCAAWGDADPRLLWVLHIAGQVNEIYHQREFVKSVIVISDEVETKISKKNNLIENEVYGVSKVKESSEIKIEKTKNEFIKKSRAIQLERKYKKINTCKINSVFSEKTEDEIFVSKAVKRSEFKNKKHTVDLEVDYINNRFVFQQFTKYLGLPFIVNVMRVLGMGYCIEKNENLFWLPGTILHAIREHVGVPKEDPVVAWLPSIENTNVLFGLVSEKYMFNVPDNRHDLFKRNIASIDEVVTGEQLLKIWLAAISRFTRVSMHMNIKQLVSRSGNIFVTPTHIDLEFNINQIDLNIRMSGVDINPGWVFWLGKIINIHFDNE